MRLKTEITFGKIGKKGELVIPLVLLVVAVLFVLTLFFSETGLTGVPVYSGNSFTVAAAPTHGTPILNSTTNSNLTTKNITVYNQSTADSDGDNITNIINWHRGGTPVAVLNMPFEGGSTGLFTKDYSGYDNNGTVYNAVWNSTGGYDGFGAYTFDGTGDYITIPDNESLRFGTNDFTISLWVKTTEANTRRLINKRGGGTWYSMILNYPSSKKFSLETSGTVPSANDVNVTDGQWHHLVVVKEETTAYYYVDGNASGSTTASSSVSNTAALEIGKYSAEYFTGKIDNVILFNRSLSLGQVQALYENRTDLIVSDELALGDVWQACITPNDRTSDGTTKCSNNLTILNNPPTHDAPVLNSSLGNNDSDENLTVHLQNFNEIDGDLVKNLTDWRLNGTSIAVLNMPFEGGSNLTWTRDYSSYGNNGSVSDADFDKSAGHDGFGAYTFDGTGDYITIPDDNSIKFGTNNFTISLWINTIETSTVRIINKRGGSTWYSLILNYPTSKRFSLETSGVPSANNHNVTDGQWHHIVITKNGTTAYYYVDGNASGSTTASSSVSNTANLEIGKYSATYYDGQIDDLILFNRSLSLEQILVLYQKKTNLLVANETNINETWQACVTPNDKVEDGQTKCSNNLTVVLFTPDLTAPTFSNAVNTSADFKINQNFTANITIDDSALDIYIFSTNATGSWVNNTFNISGAQYNASQQANVTVGGGSSVCWYYWANDTSGNSNVSTTYCFTVANTVPTQDAPVLNSTDSTLNDTDQNLTVYPQNAADVDGDNIRNITNWYKNGASITVLNLPFDTNIISNASGAVKDYSGYGNNGTLGDGNSSKVPIWTSAGKTSGAYDFDGADDFINFTDTPFDIYDNFTVSLWAKMDGESGYAFLASKALTSSSNSGWFLQSRGTGSQDRWQLDIYDGTWRRISTQFGWDFTNWHYFVFTYDSSDVRLYVDGAERNSTSVSGAVTANDISLKVGGTQSGGDFNFNGTIDEVQIYNHSLSSEQILALYENRTDLIVSQEISAGDAWQVCVTPNDGTADGVTKCTGNLSIEPTATGVSSSSGGGGGRRINNQCQDRRDNDGDNLTDYLKDPGCLSVYDDDETGEKICIQSWICNEWSSCADSKQSRTCYDEADCQQRMTDGDFDLMVERSQPDLEKNCTVLAPVEEKPVPLEPESKLVIEKPKSLPVWLWPLLFISLIVILLGGTVGLLKWKSVLAARKIDRLISDSGGLIDAKDILGLHIKYNQIVGEYGHLRYGEKIIYHKKIIELHNQIKKIKQH